MIETVKSQQAAPVAPPAQTATNPLLSISPQEEWHRKYQSQPIGLAGAPLGDLARVPRAMILPAVEIVPSRTTALAPEARPSALGAQIGKPEKPKRSWLGRLLHRI